uniref:Bestrophin homolog n=1 Tax=Caenorhabditis japonica TaxID=281687 RepID=A0A8R1I0Y1_CAEJA
MRQFRVNILSLTLFDWVPVPLVYTQVVHLAVRSYFLVALLGRQYLSPDKVRVPNYKHTIDLYVPIMSVLQFIFFIGWMKVAEVLLNPLGEDDDDFECNWILDRNLQVGLMVVDAAYNKYPDLEKDQFWEDVNPEPLYTAESAIRPLNPQIGSCADMPTDEEPFMVRPRRRTLRRMSHWDGDMEETDVVPVVGLKHPGDTSNYASGESLAFSNSFANGGRKLSEMFRRMRAGSRIGDKYRGKRHSSVQDFENGFGGKKHSIDEDADNEFSSTQGPGGTPKTGRLWSSLPQTQLEEMLKNQNLAGAHGVKYNTDGMKERDLPNPTPVTDHIDLPHLPNTWFNDSLPVIKEEEEAKRKSNTDTDSPMTRKKSKGSRTARRMELRRSSSSGSEIGKSGSRRARKKSE